jgi:lauroyl/myristoyl acyltransferase
MKPGIVQAFRLTSLVARVLPPAVSTPIARSLGRIAGYLDGDRRRLVERNLRRVCGPELSGRQLRKSVDMVFSSYADYYLQSFRLPSMTPDQIVTGFSEEGYELIADGLQAGRGVILAMPHLGSWEWAAHWLTLHHGVPVGCVVEKLDPPELFDWYRSFRTSLGIEVVGLGPNAGTKTIAMLRENRVVCLPSDRHVGGAGVDVEFFGEVTTLPAGP